VLRFVSLRSLNDRGCRLRRAGSCVSSRYARSTTGGRLRRG